MNFKTTVILLVLLIAAGAYIIVDRYAGGDKDKAEVAGETKKLFDVKKADDVSSVTIKPAEGSEIVLTKDVKNKWRMTKPVEAAAESWQVDSLVRDLVELESKASVDAAGKGLDNPKFRIEISAKGGKLIKFAVGDKTQLGDMYVRVEGKNKADVVSSDVYERLGKPASELRDKQLVSTPSTDIKQVVIETDGQKLAMQKKGNDWELTEPAKMPADESVMTDLLGAVTGLRATDWVAKDSPDLAKAQFDKPQMKVAFTTAAPATQPTTAPASQPAWTTITFGQYEDIRHAKAYAKISDGNAIVKVAATPIETLSKKPLDIRDKKVLDIVPEQVSKVSIAADIPAGTPPSTRPAKKNSVAIERRKQVAEEPKASKPAATQVAATKPTTRPSTRPATMAAATKATKPATTLASTAPTTAPATQAAPPTVWVLSSNPKGDADDEAVRNLLNDLHPLRATKYLESLPTTRPSGSYTLKFTTEGPGGTPVNQYELRLIDPGGEQPLLGTYKNLSFEVARTFLSRLDADYAKKAETSTGSKPASTDGTSFKLPGEK